MAHPVFTLPRPPLDLALRLLREADVDDNMSRFPGRVYSGDGVAMDGLVGDLTQDRIDACEGRSMVAARGLAPVAWVWLLEDGATWSAVPEGAVKLVKGGQAIVILSQRREAEVDVRDGLLGILPDSDLVEASEVAGHA